MHCLLTLLPPIPLKHSGSVPGRLASRPACSSPVLRTGVTAILPHRRNEESRRSIAEPVDEVLAILRQHGALR